MVKIIYCILDKSDHIEERVGFDHGICNVHVDEKIDSIPKSANLAGCKMSRLSTS